MIKKDDIQDDSLETIFCEPFGKLKQNPLSEEQMKIMISLQFAQQEEGAIDEMYEDLKKQAWALAALEKRIPACLTIEIEKIVQIWLTMLVEGNIGRLLMYAYYLQYWGKKNNTRTITWDDLNMHIFPMGYPSSEDMRTVWDASKVDSRPQAGPDNLIDYGAATLSIQFADEEA